MTPTLEDASQQQVLPVCSKPVQSIRVQAASGLHLSLELALFLVDTQSREGNPSAVT